MQRRTLFSLLILLTCLVVVTGVQAAEVITTPAAPQGWTVQNQRANATVAITGTEPRDGDGSLEFTTTPFTPPVSPSPDKVDYQLALAAMPTLNPDHRLGTLDALSYEYFRSSTSTIAAHLHPALRLLFVHDANTNGTFDAGVDTLGSIIFEEVYNGNVVPLDTWDANDFLTAKVWMYVNSAPGGTGVVQNYSNTLQQWIDGNPQGQPGDPVPPNIDANTYVVAVNVGIGSGWSNGTTVFHGYVDNITVGFNGANDTYNFELTAPPPPDDGDEEPDEDNGGGDTPAPQDTTSPTSIFSSSEIGGKTNGAITASGNPSVTLTALVVNGEGNLAAVGDPTLISLGIVQAVDVFSFLPGGVLATVFDPPITVCLQGAGTVYFRPAADQTGTFSPVPAFSAGGALCVTLSQPGLLVLVGTTTAPAASAPVPTGGSTPLTDCQVTTDFLLRLRADASTSSDILTRLPMGTTLDATEMVDGWYRVIYGDQQGWVSADYVSTSGNCG